MGKKTITKSYGAVKSELLRYRLTDNKINMIHFEFWMSSTRLIHQVTCITQNFHVAERSKRKYEVVSFREHCVMTFRRFFIKQNINEEVEVYK